jgi:ubiquinone biosynthesis protein UbiJ
MKAFIHQSFEKALNRFLILDPESSARLAALDGKVISIILLMKIDKDKVDEGDAGITINFKIENSRMHVLADKPEHTDVVIKGTPLSLLHMSISKQNRKQFFAEDVSIQGNLELGQQIIDLFDEMEIDWEEHTSHLLGDVSAHQVGRFVRGVKQFFRQARSSMIQNVNEYVHEEALIFPPREALEDFFQDIDVMRMDADRLEARIKRLRKIKGDSV